MRVSCGYFMLPSAQRLCCGVWRPDRGGPSNPFMCVWTLRSERQWGEGIATSRRAIMVYPPAGPEQSDVRRRDSDAPGIPAGDPGTGTRSGRRTSHSDVRRRSASHTDFLTPPHAGSIASLPHHPTATVSPQVAGPYSHSIHKQSSHGPWDSALKQFYAAATDCSGLWRDRAVA